MFTVPDNWELASLLAKLLLYIGAAGVAGGSLTAWRYSCSNRSALAYNYSYILTASIIGFQGVLLGFLVQVGLINDNGIFAMFDWDMMSILLETALGDIVFLRLLAFVLAAISSLFLLKGILHSNIVSSGRFVRIMMGLQLTALILLAFSHRVSGHVSVLSVIAQAAIIVHFVAFAAWIGCLLPFLQLSRSLDIESLRVSLKGFGDNATVILLMLLIAGTLMLLELLNSPRELFNTDYGQALLVKFVLVLAILFVAAINKLYLVPALSNTDSVDKLQTSIRYEIFLAATILVITAYLSTIIGPAEHR